MGRVQMQPGFTVGRQLVVVLGGLVFRHGVVVGVEVQGAIAADAQAAALAIRQRQPAQALVAAIFGGRRDGEMLGAHRGLHLLQQSGPGAGSG